MELLLDLLCLCLLCLTGKTLCDENGPEVIKVEEGADVMLPCSLSTKENIEFKFFDWRKVARTDGLKEVFLYDAGIHYNNGLDGQSEEFKGRVSHFQDELKHGNASIIIRNTQVTDSGVYTCDFPNFQPPQTFYIELVVVGAALKPFVTILDATAYSAKLQCEVHGNPKPKVELQDSDGNILHAKVTQDSEREGSFYITLQTTVTKTGTYRCVATQEEIRHQIYAEISVYISGFSTGWIAATVIGVLFLVAGVILAVLLYRRKKEPKRIKVEEGDDVTLPCSLWPMDITSKQFVWQKTDDGQKVFLYDNGDLYSDELPDQSEQFKGRVSYFEDELEQGNASITIRNTTRADSGEYRCSFQKHQTFCIKLDVVGPEVIKVEEGSDVTLPCSLLHKDIWLTQFNWKKMSQNDESQMEVFLYDNGDLYSDERPGQSEQFKGRVSHFQDELKQGNASITIRNTTRADSGHYRCKFPFIQKPQIFYIKLDVVASTPEPNELHPLMNGMDGIELHSLMIERL
ncbi:butyrophilin subfamily 2 member A1-like [Perca fluviatilis]|uniref:butyrophilin subfamily 2 member A1-like n=1 Tax=Perca fluviatilis TaxID=8168 RepID=UPI00196519B9|nr:butyrophilin subfamily 2 member A1-like [Perca fluviatilis]